MNRLSELRGGQTAPSHVALQVDGDRDGGAFMSDFFSEVERVKENISLIKQSVLYSSILPLSLHYLHLDQTDRRDRPASQSSDNF